MVPLRARVIPLSSTSSSEMRDGLDKAEFGGGAGPARPRRARRRMPVTTRTPGWPNTPEMGVEVGSQGITKVENLRFASVLGSAHPKTIPQADLPGAFEHRQSHRVGHAQHPDDHCQHQKG